MTLSLKPGVKTRNAGFYITPRVVLIVMVAHSVFQARGYECVVTSLMDGEHIPRSWHYIGEAADFRISHVATEDLSQLHEALRAALPGYDVLLEKDHIHIEPSGPRP
jgi:hypothetical protein